MDGEHVVIGVEPDAVTSICRGDPSQRGVHEWVTSVELWWIWLLWIIDDVAVAWVARLLPQDQRRPPIRQS